MHSSRASSDRAEAHDHRALGRRLGLFHFQEEAAGMVFWHPNGRLLYRLLEAFARRAVEAAGYREVATPQILRKPVWEASGHWSHFRHGMFEVSDRNGEAAVKPVNCPGHIQILKAGRVTHRDLPIRLAEFGLVHRNEGQGALHGLLRLRQFTQDDGHVFCRPDQARGEVEAFCRALPPFYAALGFPKVSLAFSTRPAERAGEESGWDVSEAVLRDALGRLGLPYREQPGEGAFYGPKLEFVLEDSRGRAWQCGTIQYDLVMPARFGIRYFDADGTARPMVMLHRALYGSLERFLGILLEHHGPFLPAWLAPEQVRVLPIAAAQAEAAREAARVFRALGMRCGDGDADDSLGRRVALARRDGVPFLAVIGAREAAAGRVALRTREGDLDLDREAAGRYLASACAVPHPAAAEQPFS
jgi:threonyl-tRNA synthetase